MNTEIGFTKGDQCNRNNCIGIIKQTEKEGGCSCQINPPCDYCTNLDQYCDECGWENNND